MSEQQQNSKAHRALPQSLGSMPFMEEPHNAATGPEWVNIWRIMIDGRSLYTDDEREAMEYDEDPHAKVILGTMRRTEFGALPEFEGW